MVELVEVESKKLLKDFIRFPFTLYRDHPFWVPPIFFDEWNTLNPAKNPASKFCESRLFLARKNGAYVGRIALILNRRYIEKWEKKLMRFGWVDFTDDPEVSSALFAAAEGWAKELGMEGIHGPLGFTDLDPEGMMVEGFEEEGTLPMIYNHPYYPRHLEAAGYRKDADWFQFEISVPEVLGSKFNRLEKIVMNRYKLRLLAPKTKKELLPCAHGIFDVMNSAYSSLYGVVELDEEQIQAYIKQYFGLVNPDFIKLILNGDDEVIAFAVAIPRLSAVLRRHRGRLFPFGALHLLYTLRHPKELVFYLVGVRPDYQVRGVSAALMSRLYQECIDYGISSVQTCGELENNSNIVTLMNNFENRRHIRRRCFIREL